MRKGGILADVDVHLAGETQFLIRCRDQSLHLRPGHAFLQRVVRRLICSDRDLVGQAHQLKFVFALDHAAARSHRGAAHDFKLRRGLCDFAAEHEAHSLFHAQIPGGHAQVFQPLPQELVRILVLLPGTHVGALAFGRICQ